MSRFGPEPQAFFDGVYEGDAPWDVGGPQPGLEAMLIEYPPADPILDLACGTGDLAIFLASRGHEVLGIDFVPRAIDVARERSRQLPPEERQRVDFQVADALHPSALGRQFRTVVDSGFHHLFDPPQCDDLAQELARCIEPGGRYYLIEFATEFPVPNTPRAMSEGEIRGRFSEDRGWRIVAVRSGQFQSRIAPVPAIIACVERIG